MPHSELGVLQEVCPGRPVSKQRARHALIMKKAVLPDQHRSVSMTNNPGPPPPPPQMKNKHPQASRSKYVVPKEQIPQVILSTERAWGMSLTERSRRNYSITVTHYQQFCQSMGLPAFPCTGQSISHFISYYVMHVGNKPSGIPNILTHLKDAALAHR